MYTLLLVSFIDIVYKINLLLRKLIENTHYDYFQLRDEGSLTADKYNHLGTLTPIRVKPSQELLNVADRMMSLNKFRIQEFIKQFFFNFIVLGNFKLIQNIF